jgi:predicted acetylornithine/succinylornithine family transaminase
MSLATIENEHLTLAELQELDAQNAFQNYGTRLPVAFVRGEGARMWDVEGREYIDFLAGIAVTTLGHAHPRVTEAIAHQASQITHTGNYFYIEPQVKLAAKLREISGMRAFFCNSGTEANEAAIKLARKFHKDNGHPQRVEIITTLNSFHGRTYGSLAATGQPKYHEGFAPMPEGFRYVTINDAEELRAAVGENTAAVMLEPIQGESGVIPCDDEFLQLARDLCDAQGALLICDEVQAGMGRTGKFFGYEWSGIQPDIITLAKGLANGVPIGAVLARDDVAKSLTPGSHGCTFGGNFLACAAALATLDVLFDENLMTNAAHIGDYFKSRLWDWAMTTGALREVRGCGLMIGVTLEKPVARELMLECLKNGLVFNAIGTHTLRFLPPLIITTHDVDDAMKILTAAYQTVTNNQ